MGSLKWAASSMVLANAILWGSAAFAQTATAESATADSDAGAGRDEIIVTAQRRSEKLIDVPLSITAVTGDQLLKQGITGPADLAKVSSGFVYRQSSYGNPVYQIRGIGFFEESYGLAPTVTVYVDQVPYAFTVESLGAGLDVERVEVLKGPQGTLFGQNSTGGLVNYIAAKPTDEFKAGADVGYGNYGAVDVRGFISGPLSDTLSARLAFASENRGDWQYNYVRRPDHPDPRIANDSRDPHNNTLGKRDFKTARLLLDWDPTDKLSIELNLNGWVDRSDTPAPQFVAPSANAAGGGAFTSLQPYPNFPMQTYLQGHPVAPNNARAANWDAYSTEGGPRSRYARDSWFAQAALRINYELSDDITLISLSKYSKAHLDAPSEQDGTDVPNLQMTNYGTLKTIFQELRLDGRAGDNLKWMVGGNFQQTWDYECQCYLQNNSSSSNISGPTVDHPEGLAFSFDMAGLQLRQKAKSKGVFGSLDYKLTPEFTVQASARYSTQKRHMQNCIITYGDGKIGNFFRLLSAMLRNVPFDSVTLPSYPGFYGDCVTLENEPSFVPTIAEFSLKENNLSWRLGAQWKPSNDLMLYANVTSGYKEGNFANITCVFVSQCVPARAEKVLAYEAGIKASLLDRSLDLTAAIFQMDYDNKQVAGSVLTPPFGYLTELVSVPKSKIKGAEAQMNWRPVRGLNLMAGLTYLDAKVSDIFVTAEPSGVIADRKGEALPGTPKWNATADISYDFPISDSLSAFVGGNMFYTSLTQAYFGVNPIYTNPAYTLFDARAGIEGPDGKWKLQFWGKNLTNKFYIRHTSSISDTIVRWTGMPRTYGATLSWRY